MTSVNVGTEETIKRTLAAGFVNLRSNINQTGTNVTASCFHNDDYLTLTPTMTQMDLMQQPANLDHVHVPARP